MHERIGISPIQQPCSSPGPTGTRPSGSPLLPQPTGDLEAEGGGDHGVRKCIGESRGRAHAEEGRGWGTPEAIGKAFESIARPRDDVA